MKGLKIALLVVALVCIAVAISYPIRYQLALQSNNTELEDLSSMRRRVMEQQGIEAPSEGYYGGDALPDDDGAPESSGPEDGEDVHSQTGDAGAGPVEPAPGDNAQAVQPAAGENEAQPIEPAAGDNAQPVEPAAGDNAQPVQPAADDNAQPVEPAAGDDNAHAVEPAAGDNAQPVQPAAGDNAQPVQPAAGDNAQPVEPAAGENEAQPVEPAAGDNAQPVQPAAGDDNAHAVQPAAGDNAQVVQPAAGDNAQPVEPVAGENEAQAAEPAMSGATPPPDLGAEMLLPEDMATRVPAMLGGVSTPIPDVMFFIINDPEMVTPTPSPSPTPSPTPSPSPSPTPDRSVRTDAMAFPYKEKVRLDESKILPELKDIYALNRDLVGWIYIEDTLIDYPVVQTSDSDFYLKHDFYGKSNANGQIILDTKCDPYTPSYNLIISGHHMNSGAMFGRLPLYRDRKYWEKHKIVEFDTLMARKVYVIFAVFYSADYDEDEEGFRYNADIQYRIDAEQWLGEIRDNQIYDTGIDVEFGDEFITLTTCDRSRRRNGRFVAVARRLREGENIK